MTDDDSEKLIAWARMNAATELMNIAYEMIWGALWASDNTNDPIGVNDHLHKLIVDVGDLTDDMQHGTSKLFRDLLDDEKPTTAE